MYTILIVDVSLYRDSIMKVFRSGDYKLIPCESAYDALKHLKAHDIDLVVSDVELPGDNAFDLYNYIGTNYPYIPVIMTTDKNIDTFFDQIFQEGIGNVLCKPVKKEELLNLAEKLITRKNIFGLGNYMPGLVEMKKIRITASGQITRAIALIIQEIEGWGFPVKNRAAFNLLINEMAINAVYHSHGHTEEKLARKSVQLREGGCVDIFFGHNRTGYGIAIDDYNGKLTKMRILESINRVIEQGHLLEKAAETGEDISLFISETGRGIDLVRKLTGEYYFIMKKNERTEIMIIFDGTYTTDDCENYSSLKIIEDNSPDAEGE